MGKKIYASWPLLPISVKSNKASLEQFYAFGKEKKAGYNLSSLATIMTTSPTTSAIILPKVGFFGNTFCENRQFNNKYASLLFLLLKSNSSNKIFSGKVNKSAPCMMLKPAFIEKFNKNNNDTDFELAFLVRIFFTRDNQTQRSVMGCNVGELPGKQRLLGVELLKKEQLDEWLYCHRCGWLNVIWYENVLDKPCVDLVMCLDSFVRYFYTHIFVSKTDLLFLTLCCYFKINYPENTHNCFRIM